MRVPLAIVDYGAGNLTSVFNAIQYLGLQGQITSDPTVVRAADRVIFPGVGAARASMDVLVSSGLGQAVHDAVLADKPVLGICIGCQIILRHSEEDGGVDCLGLLPGNAVRFHSEPSLKIPHMGWNQVNFTTLHPIFSGIADKSEFYFVHSFHPLMDDPATVAAYTTYGTQRFAAAIFRNNLVATQFHLEKSGEIGLKVLHNFCQWDGKSC
ncbi:MAG TPA: imidazole glycerol phosphate synthase subunit HisH [Fibrobacteraceae bacterium]|nr:imidazole glycerol phosphate synthase subunit HisH [Fibrobacteraceae bacterium]